MGSRFATQDKRKACRGLPAIPEEGVVPGVGSAPKRSLEAEDSDDSRPTSRGPRLSADYRPYKPIFHSNQGKRAFEDEDLLLQRPAKGGRSDEAGNLPELPVLEDPRVLTEEDHDQEGEEEAEGRDSMFSGDEEIEESSDYEMIE